MKNGRKITTRTVSVSQIFSQTQRKKFIDNNFQTKFKKYLFKETQHCLTSQSIKYKNGKLSKKTYTNIKAFSQVKKLNKQSNKIAKFLKEEKIQQQKLNLLIPSKSQYKAFPKRQSLYKNNNPVKFYMNSIKSKSIKNYNDQDDNQLFSDMKITQMNQSQVKTRSVTEITPNFIQVSPLMELFRIKLPKSNINWNFKQERPKTTNRVRTTKIIRNQKIAPWDNNINFYGKQIYNNDY